MSRKGKTMARQIAFSRGLGTWFVGLRPAGWHRTRLDTGSGPQDITFKLPGNRYRFDEADPIWVEADSGSCPPNQGVDCQIQNIKAGPTELTLTNTNETKGDLRYQLNVIDTRTNARVPIDPIMENGGRTFG